MMGFRISPTSEATILPKATPMITPMARSRTLPRMMKVLNSLNIFGAPGLHQYVQASIHWEHGEKRATHQSHLSVLPGGTAHRPGNQRRDPARGTRQATDLRRP